MAERIYCSEQNAHEPMMGTADRVDVWLLLEYKPAWKARAVDDNNLDEGTRAWLADQVDALAALGLRARPQLIRQPEIDSDQVRLLVGLPERLLAFSGRGYDFLENLDLTAVVAQPEAHRALRGPRYFVCTNGQRDLCCARFGLPCYTALREHVGERVWQVTHLGGHRFAPNVLVLPQGALYGRVSADAVAPFVRAVEGGELAFERLRGRTWYPPAVQAAEALSGRSDLSYVAMEGDDSHAEVRFQSAGGPVSVAVGQGEPVTVLASCGDAAPKPVRPYRPV